MELEAVVSGQETLRFILLRRTAVMHYLSLFVQLYHPSCSHLSALCLSTSGQQASPDLRPAA